MQYIAKHLGIFPIDWQNNNLLLLLTLKLSLPKLVLEPCVCSVGFPGEIFWKEKAAPESCQSNLQEIGRLDEIFGKETKRTLLSLCIILIPYVCLSLQLMCCWEIWEKEMKTRKKKKKIYKYVQRKTVLQIYIQSAKYQAGLSALKQSFLS